MLVVWERKCVERSRDSQGREGIILISRLCSLSRYRSQVTEITGDGCGAAERGRWYTNEEDQDNEVSHVDVVSI